MAGDHEDYTILIYNITSNIASDDELRNKLIKEGNDLLHIVATSKNNSSVYMNQVIKYLQKCPFLINSKNKKGQTPLHIAARGTNSDLIKIFLDNGASVNIKDENNCSPFHIAAVKGYKKIIEMMLERNVDVHLQTGKKQTALHLAVQHRNCIVAEILLDRGANVNVQDEEGATALSMAVRLGDLTMVELLLERGGNINIMDHRAQSLLHIAASQWNYRVVKLLMDRGALLNTQDVDGKTPLHIAIENQDLSMVEKLLLRGVLTDGLDNDHGTPLLYAVKTGFPLLVQKLIVQGSTVEALSNSLDDLQGITDTDTLKSHLVKLYVANLISKEQIKISNEYLGLKKSCEEELERMRNNKFKSVNLSHVFDKSLKTENHPQFSKALCSAELDHEFPLYSVILKATFLKAKQRPILIRKCRAFFTIIHTFKFKFVAKFNIETKDTILNHFSNIDLHNLLIYCENVLRDELVRPRRTPKMNLDKPGNPVARINTDFAQKKE